MDRAIQEYGSNVMRKPLERVLFVGGGRRVSLAQMFRKRGVDVMGYELNPVDAPISLVVSKMFKGLKWEDEHKLELDLFRKMMNYHIDFTIPFQDKAVAVLSRFEQIPSVCSPPEAAEKCYDKAKFERFCLEHFPDNYPSLPTTDALLKGRHGIVWRPQFGYGSNGIKFGSNNTWSSERPNENCVVTRFIKGQEYTVDTYTDRKGNVIGVSPRKRERVDGGEVVNATTIYHEGMMDLVARVVQKLGVIGPACTQVIEEEGTGDLYLIECNARFGGGTVLSIYAGLDMVEMIKEEYPHNPSPELCQWNKWHPNIKMRRFYQEHYVP